jgi:hypothetical protein
MDAPPAVTTSARDGDAQEASDNTVVQAPDVVVVGEADVEQAVNRIVDALVSAVVSTSSDDTSHAQDNDNDNDNDNEGDNNNDSDNIDDDGAKVLATISTTQRALEVAEPVIEYEQVEEEFDQEVEEEEQGSDGEMRIKRVIKRVTRLVTRPKQGTTGDASDQQSQTPTDDASSTTNRHVQRKKAAKSKKKKKTQPVTRAPVMIKKRITVVNDDGEEQEIEVEVEDPDQAQVADQSNQSDDDDDSESETNSDYSGDEIVVLKPEVRKAPAHLGAPPPPPPKVYEIDRSVWETSAKSNRVWEVEDEEEWRNQLDEECHGDPMFVDISASRASDAYEITAHIGAYVTVSASWWHSRFADIRNAVRLFVCAVVSLALSNKALRRQIKSKWH